MGERLPNLVSPVSILFSLQPFFIPLSLLDHPWKTGMSPTWRNRWMLGCSCVCACAGFEWWQLQIWASSLSSLLLSFPWLQVERCLLSLPPLFNISVLCSTLGCLLIGSGMWRFMVRNEIVLQHPNGHMPYPEFLFVSFIRLFLASELPFGCLPL